MLEEKINKFVQFENLTIGKGWNSFNLVVNGEGKKRGGRNKVKLTETS